MNRAGEIRSGWNDDLAAAGFRTLIDRAAKSGGAIGSPITFGAEAIEIETCAWENEVA